ncbi:hypothetical protein JN27_03705 [Massilia sp. BSC265]|nr:hypothetical protein JN27_03705 [Massilia sp. BSC265]
MRIAVQGDRHDHRCALRKVGQPHARVTVSLQADPCKVALHVEQGKASTHTHPQSVGLAQHAARDGFLVGRHALVVTQHGSEGSGPATVVPALHNKRFAPDLEQRAYRTFGPGGQDEQLAGQRQYQRAQSREREEGAGPGPAPVSTTHRPDEPVGLVLGRSCPGGKLSLLVFDGAVRPLSLPGLLGSAPLPHPLFPFSLPVGGGQPQSVPATISSSCALVIRSGAAKAGMPTIEASAIPAVSCFSMIDLLQKLA